MNFSCFQILHWNFKSVVLWAGAKVQWRSLSSVMLLELWYWSQPFTKITEIKGFSGTGSKRHHCNLLHDLGYKIFLVPLAKSYYWLYFLFFKDRKSIVIHASYSVLNHFFCSKFVPCFCLAFLNTHFSAAGFCATLLQLEEFSWN